MPPASTRGPSSTPALAPIDSLTQWDQLANHLNRPDDDGRLLLRLMQVLEAAMDLEQFASVFQMRLAPDLAAAYLQLVQHQSQGPGTTTTVAEEAGRRLEGLAARVGPRVMVTAMRGLLARGAAAPGSTMDGWMTGTGTGTAGMDGAGRAAGWVGSAFLFAALLTF